MSIAVGLRWGRTILVAKTAAHLMAARKLGEGGGGREDKRERKKAIMEGARDKAYSSGQTSHNPLPWIVPYFVSFHCILMSSDYYLISGLIHLMKLENPHDPNTFPKHPTFQCMKLWGDILAPNYSTYFWISCVLTIPSANNEITISFKSECIYLFIV